MKDVVLSLPDSLSCISLRRTAVFLAAIQHRRKCDPLLTVIERHRSRSECIREDVILCINVVIQATCEWERVASLPGVNVESVNLASDYTGFVHRESDEYESVEVRVWCQICSCFCHDLVLR